MEDVNFERRKKVDLWKFKINKSKKYKI
jgi:hypothetical protein